ncbi:MAG: cation transporter [Alphaproteobacteria bacterium]|nr:MAG: cation transporter [Alphaproteobacteria bacterium]
MGAEHGHHHRIDALSGDRRVAGAIAVNLALTVAQIVGGVLSGSLALVADAIHNLSDAVALILALAARRIARRPANAAMSFGYGRAEIVAALINYTTLCAIAFYLVAEAAMRLFDPPEIAGWTMVLIAAVALVVDAVTVLLTLPMARHSANMRAAYLHNLADALGSVAVIGAGSLILLYDWRLADPIVTLGIAAYILWHVFREIAPVVRILMLAGPAGIDRDAVVAAIGEIEGVLGVHHLHLWQIDERRMSLEAHVIVEDLTRFPALSAEIRARLKGDFGITHATLEPETAESGCAAMV